jgi:hypothetical protein
VSTATSDVRTLLHVAVAVRTGLITYIWYKAQPVVIVLTKSHRTERHGHGHWHGHVHGHGC